MKKELKTAVVTFVCALVMSAGVHAQESDAFKKYGQEFKGKIAKSYAESKEWWPTPSKPPAGTPNAIILLLDDTGFGHLSSFGGLVETPNMDKLAEDGLRYNNFHTTALCSPSRATIMAARNHHRIGLGSHSLTAMGFPGYNAFSAGKRQVDCKAFAESRFCKLCYWQMGSHTAL